MVLLDIYSSWDCVGSTSHCGWFSCKYQTMPPGEARVTSWARKKAALQDRQNLLSLWLAVFYLLGIVFIPFVVLPLHKKMQEKKIKIISPTCSQVLFRYLQIPPLPFWLVGVTIWVHWPGLGGLHEGTWLFILLSPLPYSCLSSSRADPSKMHFRWRRNSLLGASNIHQVCFYWLQEHTDDGKADQLLSSQGFGSLQMLLTLLYLKKWGKQDFHMKGRCQLCLTFLFLFLSS